MFIPKDTPDTVYIKRSYTTRDGTFTAGHRFTRLVSIPARPDVITLVDDDGRYIDLTPYEFERLV